MSVGTMLPKGTTILLATCKLSGIIPGLALIIKSTFVL